VEEHEPPRSVRFVGPDRVQDVLVRLLRRSGGADVAHVVERLHQKVAVRAHRRREQIVSRGFGDHDVEVHARLGVRRLLAHDRPPPLDGLFDAGDGRGSGAGGRKLAGRGLDDGPGLGHAGQRHSPESDHRGDRLGDLIDVRVGDERAAGRADLHPDKSPRFEDSKRVPDRDPGDRKPLGEVALRLEPVSGTQLAPEDRTLDLGHDLDGGTRLPYRRERGRAALRLGRPGGHARIADEAAAGCPARPPPASSR